MVNKLELLDSHIVVETLNDCLDNCCNAMWCTENFYLCLVLSAETCPSPWLFHAGHCYLFLQEVERDYQEAEDSCKNSAQQANLVSINDKQELAFISSILKVSEGKVGNVVCSCVFRFCNDSICCISTCLCLLINLKCFSLFLIL